MNISPSSRYHDLAKLTFAVCALWTYLIFSQILVIWFADLPEETPYLIMRMQSVEWGWMFWVLFVLMFIIPFFGLMSRTACNSIWFSRLIAVVGPCRGLARKIFPDCTVYPGK